MIAPRRLNVDRMFRPESRHYIRSKSDPPAQGLRDKKILGVFSLAGLSFVTSVVHLGFAAAVIVASLLLEKDIKPTPITQSVNVWAPDMEDVDAMFPTSRMIAANVTLSGACSPFTPNTIAFRGRSVTIFPKTLLVGTIDNRVSMGVFFFLSFAFQFCSVVDAEDMLRFIRTGERPAHWLGKSLYASLERGRVSKAHFIEYSFSATLMVLVMVTQIGVTDLSALLSICINTWACMIIGLLAEYIVDAEDSEEIFNQTVWGVHLSFIAHLLGWVPLIPVFFAMLTQLLTYKTCITGTADIPTAVLIFVGGEIVLFSLFGLVQCSSIINVQRIRDRCKKELLLQNAATGDPKATAERKRALTAENASAAEAQYVLLSLTAKAFLALTIYIGIQAQPG